MIKIQLTVVSLLLVFNCQSSRSTIFKMSMAQVKLGKNSVSNTSLKNSEENGKIHSQFSDKNIEITWIPGKYEFRFHLLNKTSDDIVIFWKEIIFLDVDNFSYQSISKNSQLYTSQKKTIIPANAKYSGWIAPYGRANRGKHQPASNSDFGNLLGRESIFPQSWKFERQKQYKNKKIQILLPLQIEGKKKRYTFDFLIKDVYKRK